MHVEMHVCILSLRSLNIQYVELAVEMFVLARFIENVWPLRQRAFDLA